MPPPSQGIIGPMVKTFLFAATLPVTLPILIYKYIKGDFKRVNSDPFGGFNGFNGFNGFGGFDGFNGFGGFNNENPYSNTTEQHTYYSYVSIISHVVS